MKTLAQVGLLSLAVSLPAGLVFACGGSGSSGGPLLPTKSGVAVSNHDSGDDRSRCDFRGRTDREVVESSGPGAIGRNIRRVYTVVGEGAARRKILQCREVDTNLDGMKDVVRTYDDKGEVLHEQADADHDGRIDTWITFARGRMSKVQLDADKDGNPDETRYYVQGKLSRIERDTNKNGKNDVWEIYHEGQLERMGLDLDGDGHVDRWDRDEVARRIAEAKEREDDEKHEKEEAEKKAKELEAGPPPTDARVSVRKR